MTTDFGTVLENWDGQAVVIRHDKPSGAWMFVALHDDTLGGPVGGCRMRVYDHPAEGLLDATRLAAGMTAKWAAMEFPFGGGKSVLAVPRKLEGEERRGLLKRFAHLLNTLQGTYRGGEDLGTTPEDMAFLARHTPHMMGAHGPGGPADPGPFTALGVFVGIRSALNAAFGSREFVGRSVLVQGVGDVGIPLARMIADAGGTVLAADLDPEVAARVASEHGGRVVDPGAVYCTSCDVYAPCAIGATLNPETIPQLECRIVAGSANNQLLSPEDGDRLHQRGILYAPDYVINGGGAMAFGLMHRGVEDREELNRSVATIEQALDEIFEESSTAGITPAEASDRRVRRILEKRRA